MSVLSLLVAPVVIALPALGGGPAQAPPLGPPSTPAPVRQAACPRQLVFSDISAKQRLEAILHPLIRLQMLAQAESVKNSPYLLLAIPLLFETSNYLPLVQRTLIVDCAETTQIVRAMQRSGLTELEVRAIMAKQISRSERLRAADDVIQNDAGLDALRLQVANLHQRYIALSAGSD